MNKKSIKLLAVLLAAVAVLLVAAVSVAAFSPVPVRAESDEKLSVVTSIFPVYDWVREILGEQAENVNLTLLLDNGVDLHNYQPTAEDMVEISNCDLFLYVGGESDEWAEDVLKGTGNEEINALNLLETLGSSAKLEDPLEGMEAEEEDGEEEEEEYDEHIWLSLKNASLLCEAICENLSQLDPDHADTYAANTEAYCEKLSALDAEYQKATEEAPVKTLLFGDRFPFRYLSDDYGLTCYAAFSDCSAETEASFETISFLAGKVDELNLSSVMTLEGTEHKIAQTIVSASKNQDAQILTLDSMQSITSEDIKEGAKYLSIMEKNLDVLKEALR